MKKRLGKKMPLDIIDEIETSYGTLNRLNPEVIYISGKFWIKPLQEMDYNSVLDEIISKIKNSFKYNVKRNQQWGDKIIFDMDIKTYYMSTQKKSYGDFELYVHQNKDSMKDMNRIAEDIFSLCNPILKEFIHELHENDFIITKSKK